jgi:hypothetical protein
MARRGKLDVDSLLKIVLVLVIVWLGLEIVSEVFDLLFGPFVPVVGLLVLVLIVLYLLDRI